MKNTKAVDQKAAIQSIMDSFKLFDLKRKQQKMDRTKTLPKLNLKSVRSEEVSPEPCGFTFRLYGNSSKSINEFSLLSPNKSDKPKLEIRRMDSLPEIKLGPEIRGSYNSVPLSLKPIDVGFDFPSAKNSVAENTIVEENEVETPLQPKIRFLDKLKKEQKVKLTSRKTNFTLNLEKGSRSTKSPLSKSSCKKTKKSKRKIIMKATPKINLHKKVRS